MIDGQMPLSADRRRGAARLHNLQLLRAFAALNVVVMHALVSAHTYGMPADVLGFLVGWGNNGVDIFFVLSGFIMAHTQQSKRRPPCAFLRDRVIRIVPIYWQLTAIFIALLLIAPSLSREQVVTWPHAAASFFFVSGIWVGQFPYIYVGWTLEYEFLFYGVFAVALLSGSFARRFIITAILLLTAHLIFGARPFVYEFLFGMVVAMSLAYWPRSSPVGVGWTSLLLGIVGLGSSLIIDYPASISQVFYWGVPAAFLVLGAALLPQVRPGLMTFLGDASYSIYLIQVFTLPAFYKAANWFYPALEPVSSIVLATFLTALAGATLYVWVERPSHYWLRCKSAATP